MLHDLHPDADNAAWRAAMLARPHGGWLRILHVSRLRHPQAGRDHLAPLAWRLQEHLQVAVLTHAYRGSLAGELRRAAEDADLVVLRAATGLDAATGLHPVRAMLVAGRPTLVVRTPANVPYRRLVVGAAPDADAAASVATAAGLSDGQEVPAVVPAASAAALLERERSLFPDLVTLPCGPSTWLARRFLALTRVDTLLLPMAAQPRAPVAGALAGHGLLLSPGDLPPAGEHA